MFEPTACYSCYFQTLDENSKATYKEKLAMLGDMQDPYLMINVVSFEECTNYLTWSNFEYPDIYNYFKQLLVVIQNSN